MGAGSQSAGSEHSESWFSGAFGAGLMLVLLPGFGLFFGIEYLNRWPGVGLPLLAIFGIMILFGSLALVSTLFERLNLSDKNEALALPNGSIRATIALALIVLFAIIAIMVYQSLSRCETRRIDAVPAERMQQMVAAKDSRVIATAPDCPKDKSECGMYSVYLEVAPNGAATDVAKQLLTLIGTLMTSVTSFYFAARTVEKAAEVAKAAPPNVNAAPQHLAAGATNPDDALDGCNVPITNATLDDQLPIAHGGVANS